MGIATAEACKNWRLRDIVARALRDNVPELGHIPVKDLRDAIGKTQVLGNNPKGFPTKHIKPQWRASEAEQQAAIVKLCRSGILKPDVVVFSVPNERGTAPSEGMIANLIAMGMLPGMADLVFFKKFVVPGMDGFAVCRAFAMEVKKDRRAKHRKNQQEVRDMLAAIGCPYKIVRDVNEAHLALIEWGLVKRSGGMNGSLLKGASP